MLFLLALLGLFPLIGICDVFMRDDCWCRNATHVGWTRHYQLNCVHIEGGPSVIDEWCFEKSRDGHGECLDQHTKQYGICASHAAIHNNSRRNDFCFRNHGNSRGMVPHWSHGDDWIEFNDQKRNIPFHNPPLPVSTEENTKYCEPICRDFRDWNLPVMDPWRPSKHGIVESRHQIFTDVKDLLFNDGAAGPWPVTAYVHKRPGGVSTTGAGLMGYWEIEDRPIP